MSEQIETATVAPAIPRRWRAFLMPRRLIYDNGLNTLSHDALKLYCFLAHKSYKKLDQPVKLALWQLEKVLNIESASAARSELKRADLIDFEVVTTQVALYEICRDQDPWTGPKTIQN